MPILTCYTQHSVTPDQWSDLTEAWSEKIKVARKDICIHVVTDFLQISNQYVLKVELSLPSLWPDEAIQHIQHSFLNLVETKLCIEREDIFLMTHLIQSGHVIDRGKLEEWQ